jgi:glutamine synthetase
MIVEYIWLDANQNPRSKTKILYQKKPKNLNDLELPLWNYDGSSTGQAEGHKSEVILKPQSVFPDPFRGGECIMVLCDTYNPDMTPHETNTRVNAEKIFEKYKDEKSMFGIEQEFFLMKEDNILAFNIKRSIGEGLLSMAKQGDYYCGNGSNNSLGRDCVESAMKRCILAGIHITGMNAEVAPSQWELQVCADGILAADQLIMMRYILNRTAEMYHLWINYHPKPLDGDWNGSGCHVNFSTEKMRGDNGYQLILDTMPKLSDNHHKHMEKYGLNNNLRMTGKHETSSYDTFSFGVGNRGASVRIPYSTEKDRKGYFEDRRPASNMDPYVVTSMILETSLS